MTFRPLTLVFCLFVQHHPIHMQPAKRSLTMTLPFCRRSWFSIHYEICRPTSFCIAWCRDSTFRSTTSCSGDIFDKKELKPMDSFGMWWKSNEIMNHNFIVLCELLLPCQLFAQKCSNCQEITKISKCSVSPPNTLPLVIYIGICC